MNENFYLYALCHLSKNITETNHLIKNMRSISTADRIGSTHLYLTARYTWHMNPSNNCKNLEIKKKKFKPFEARFKFSFSFFF